MNMWLTVDCQSIGLFILGKPLSIEYKQFGPTYGGHYIELITFWYRLI